MKKTFHTWLVVFFIFQAFFVCAQSFIHGKVLNQAGWNNYFTTTRNIHSAGTISIETVKTDIPFPKEWKYIQGKPYRLYTFSYGDYLFMSAHNEGTYMLYLDHSNEKKDFLEMNFTADSITCQQLPKGIVLFRLINSEFVQGKDTLKLNRYVFANSIGKISPKALLTHNCNISYNSTDTLHHIIYFNIEYKNHATGIKGLRFNYVNGLFSSDMADVNDIRETVVIDDVHCTSVTGINGK